MRTVGSHELGKGNTRGRERGKLTNLRGGVGRYVEAMVCRLPVFGRGLRGCVVGAHGCTVSSNVSTSMMLNENRRDEALGKMVE